MGRSDRITRTFHNRPKNNMGDLASASTGVAQTWKTNIPTPQTTKHVSGSSNRSEEPKRQTYYNNRQAHAQEEQIVYKGTAKSNVNKQKIKLKGTKQYKSKGELKQEYYAQKAQATSKTVYKGRTKRTDIKKGRGTPSPLDQFAQGVNNNVRNIFGFVTGTDQGTKSVLNKATDQALAGDWGSAGNTIANNPYKFAGNVLGGGSISVLGGVASGVATNVGNTLFPANRAFGQPTPQPEKRYKSKGELKQEYYAQKAKEAKEKEDTKNSLFGGYGQFL